MPRLKLYQNLSKGEKRPRARSMRYPASQLRRRTVDIVKNVNVSSAV
jgi:hypothetical protein